MKGMVQLEEEQGSGRNLGLKKTQEIQAVGISKVWKNLG